MVIFKVLAENLDNRIFNCFNGDCLAYVMFAINVIDVTGHKTY